MSMAYRNERDLERLSFKELTDLQGKIQKALAYTREAERTTLKQKMAALAESHGFSVAELFGGVSGRPKNGKPIGAAKYVNPANKAQTWTGRGRRPFWLDDLLKAGHSLSDFEI